MVSWGWNSSGQLGYVLGGPPFTDSSVYPSRINDGDTGVAAVSAGYLHSLALHSDGSVRAWGSNDWGQVGDNGSVPSQPTPVVVRGLERGSAVVAVAAGAAHSLALKADGSVVAWGYNGQGQLGVGGENADRVAPTEVTGLGPGSGVVAIAAGGNHFLALKGDGTVLAWGEGEHGKLGLGGTGAGAGAQTTPAVVTGLGPGSGVVAVAAGTQASMALKADGSVLAWGSDSDGQLGDGGEPQDQPAPVAVAGLGAGSGVTAVAAGGLHMLALRSDGRVLAWGSDERGQLGDGGENLDRSTPAAVIGLGPGNRAVAVAAGLLHNLVLRADGSVVAWGSNHHNATGTGTNDLAAPGPVPHVTTSDRPVVALAAGFGHSLVVTAGLARASTFSPLTPVRAWDSRVGPGPLGRLGPGGTAQIKVTGVGGVPPVGATGVVLNVTAIGPTAPTFVTAWATGERRPDASNLNVPTGDTRADLVTVKVGVGGQVSFFNSTGTTDLVVDIAGWYGPGGGQRYTPISPKRVWDTRSGPGPLGRLGPGGTQGLKVTGGAGIPGDGVSAVTLNLTAVTPSAPTFLTAWPAGQPPPLASNLNLPAGDTRANLVTVKVGVDGRIAIANDSGTTDVIVDVAGYFSASGDALTISSPVRRWDSRTGTVAGGRLGPRDVRTLSVGYPGSAVVLNLTAASASSGTFVTVWPTGEARPVASNLNLPGGDTRANLVVVKAGAGGQVSFYNEAGTVDLIADVGGWFEPPGTP